MSENNPDMSGHGNLTNERAGIILILAYLLFILSFAVIMECRVVLLKSLPLL